MMIQWVRRSQTRLACSVGMLAVVLAAHPAVSDTLATPGLWEHPADLRDRDLFYGPWGAGRAPDPAATYTFIRPKHGGVNPGVVVRDEGGRVWHVKQPPVNSQGTEGPVE